MRLFLATVLLMTMALVSAACGEERLALVVSSPVYDGAPAIANADGSSDRIGLRKMGFAVRLLGDGEYRTGMQSTRPSLQELMPTGTNSARQGLGICAPKPSS